MDYELTPKLLPGTVLEVSERDVKVTLKGRMGIIQVPLRCVISDHALQVGQTIKVYLSYIQVV